MSWPSVDDREPPVVRFAVVQTRSVGFEGDEIEGALAEGVCLH
jgi:hypothetical protein